MILIQIFYIYIVLIHAIRHRYGLDLSKRIGAKNKKKNTLCVIYIYMMNMLEMEVTKLNKTIRGSNVQSSKSSQN